jgi:hypothetical protein
MYGMSTKGIALTLNVASYGTFEVNVDSRHPARHLAVMSAQAILLHKGASDSTTGEINKRKQENQFHLIKVRINCNY